MALGKPNWRATAVVMGTCLSYAVLRHHIAEGVSWSHFPLWTTNKAIALGGMVMICLSYISSRLPNPRSWPRYFGFSGFGLSAIHTLASLLLFAPANYPRLFAADGRPTWAGETTLLFGCLCLTCYALAAFVSVPGIKSTITPQSWLRWQWLGAWGLYLALAHIAIIGLTEGLAHQAFNEWRHPGQWPKLGFLPLPSCALLGTLFILFTIPYRHLRTRRRLNR